MDSGETVDLVFLVVSKAFDGVNQRFLIMKLKAYGINDKVVNWIESFLKERTFNISIKGKHIPKQGCSERCPSRICAWPYTCPNLRE